MRQNRKALRINLITIIAVYFLILIGGIVRSMGAGMGCPDWPKCFGSYIPPSSVQALPEGYEQLYVEKRVEKNQRLASVLKTFGMADLAMKIQTEAKVFEATFFDVQKAWVEYVNRLIGVLIGLFIILNLLFSLSYWKEKKSVTLLAVGSLILVLFQGWVGSLVVSTNLIPGFISFHMILAILLVALLMLQRFQMSDNEKTPVVGRYWILGLLILFTAQILLGVQVREQIDLLKSTSLDRDSWIGQLSVVFYVHRTYSLLLMAIAGYLLYINYKKHSMNSLLYILGAVMILEILLGAVLSYFSLPAIAQPAHLLLGTLAFGVIFYLFLQTNFKRNYS